MAIARSMITVFWLASATAVAADEPAYPYSARVREAAVHVRSGPGEDYYPTDKLAAETEVEVYRHEPDGWCAIRPPRHSFSWVSSRHVALVDDEFAEVTDENAPSRIGSRFSNVRTAVHVRLHRGEKLQVLETYNGGGQTWYKIAPPSGEFRWIARADLEVPGTAESPDVQLVRHDAPPLIYRQAQRDSRLESVAADPRPLQETPPEPSPRVTKWRPATSGVTDDSDDQSRRNSISDPSKRWQRPGRTATDQARSQAAPQQAVPTAAEFEQQLMDVEQDVAVMVADDPSQWYADRLLHEVDIMAGVAPTFELREQAVRLGERIARLDDIYSRRMALDGDAAWTSERVDAVPPADAVPFAESEMSQLADRREMVSRQPARVDRRPGPRPPSESPSVETEIKVVSRGGGEVVVIPEDQPATSRERPRFDGQGILRTVVSRRRDAPRYALVDDNNDVVSFITPSPGVNLQPFIGRHVGVTGTRGFMVDYQRDHVTAARVTPIQTATR